MRVCMYSVFLRRCCSTKAGSSTLKTFQLPEAVLPTEFFLRQLDKRIKNKLAQRLVEVEYLYTISTEVPQELNEEHWRDLCDIPSVRERESYLRSLHFSELSREKTEQNNAEQMKKYYAWMDEERKRFEAGEMVYGSSFYSLYSCVKGEDFRKMVDRLYGCKFWESHRLNEPLTKLVIDCQNLHKVTTFNTAKCMREIQLLYEKNWFSRDPYEILIVNFLVDQTIARIIRKHWSFFFGPLPLGVEKKRILRNCLDHVVLSLESAENNSYDLDSACAKKSTDLNNTSNFGKQSEFNEFCNSLDENNNNNDMLAESVNSGCRFEPHPFAPKITSRGIFNTLKQDGIRKDEIVYLSPFSREFFDEELQRRQLASNQLTKNQNSTADLVMDNYDYDHTEESKPSPFIKAFVLSVSENSVQPWHNSLSAAIADEIPAYRLPVEKYVVWKSGSKTLSLLKNYQILHGVMKRGMSWANAFKNFIPERHKLASQSTVDNNDIEKLQQQTSEGKVMRIATAEKRKHRIKMLEDMVLNIQQRHMDLTATLPVTSANNEQQQQPLLRKRVHRYSREERNERRRNEKTAFGEEIRRQQQ